MPGAIRSGSGSSVEGPPSISDHTQQQYGASQQAQQQGGGVTVVQQPSSNNLQQQQQRCCGSCMALLLPTRSQRRLFFMRLLNSRGWRLCLILCTFILLFGGQIRTLAIPPTGDVAVDVVFMITFCFFWLDIMMRIDTEPAYCPVVCCCCRHHHQRGQCPHMGSFLFWCDVISSLMLLRDISFIAIRNFATPIIDLNLDPGGNPIDGLETVNQATPIELEVDLLMTIGKTARVARFIRSEAAVKISSKVNWYWFLKIFDPAWWWRNLSCLHNDDDDQRNSSSSGSMRQDGGVRASLSGDDTDRGYRTDQPSGTMSPAVEGGGGDHTASSWDGLRMMVMANVRATAKAKEEQSQFSWLKRLGRKPLKWMGLVLSEKEEFRRQLAATRIQRAWRASQESRGHLDEHASDCEDRDVAWQGRAGASNAMEKTLKKKSFIHRHGSKNADDSKSSSTPVSPADEEAAARIASRSRISLGGPNPYAQRRHESQVGSAMRELTGQRVAIGIIIALAFTVLFTYTEDDSTRPSTMIVLHRQTNTEAYADKALTAARRSSVPDMYYYRLANGLDREYSMENGNTIEELRDREILQINVIGHQNGSTTGLFDYKNERQKEALVSILAVIFIILVWFFGVTAFAGPVMILVVIPIERMVRLLGMLMLDPLGYQSTSRYKRFVAEEDEITKNTRWTKEVLKGMETSFLMSTILRIGSLMKVGFGTAGIDIIRNNLEGRSKNMLILNSQGTSVSCIFLFCDIRQFTDATECLQEEVFVFTNRIAAVVHSYCHSYGGSANKNIGDAFLVSWQLDDQDAENDFGFGGSDGGLVANNHQADKALLTVVKICIALYHNDYYIEKLSQGAREALLSKLSQRKGPVVQMGCGLHAGKAVQGAIGSQRKIDATYVSEAVERAEDLESWTKKYGTKMLMSDSFHRLLDPRNRGRCRKIDQLLIREDDEEEADDDYLSGEVMELFTFDMDIDALWQKGGGMSESESDSESNRSLEFSKRDMTRGRSSTGLTAAAQKAASPHHKRGRGKRTSKAKPEGGFEVSEAGFALLPTPDSAPDEFSPPVLNLPTRPVHYNANVWVSQEMRKIRDLYQGGLGGGIFFQQFNSGLQAYYAKDWASARRCFVGILDRFEDGPSRYFLNQMEKHNNKPPRGFLPYGTP